MASRDGSLSLGRATSLHPEEVRRLALEALKQVGELLGNPVVRDVYISPSGRDVWLVFDGDYPEGFVCREERSTLSNNLELVLSAVVLCSRRRLHYAREKGLELDVLDTESIAVGIPFILDELNKDLSREDAVRLVSDCPFVGASVLFGRY